jgi:SpoVK/Ycf46/Vps4 family AAA+-type ATPase
VGYLCRWHACRRHAFLLTTNRADLLEPALAQRPGRMDHAALLPLPDAAARRRLLRLYQRSLELDLADPDAIIGRTEGVTASFIKELLRRAALRAAEEAGHGGAAGNGRPLRVTADRWVWPTRLLACGLGQPPAAFRARRPEVADGLLTPASVGSRTP